METCRVCGASLREGAQFCSSCGTAVQAALFCRQCGTELMAGDKFCFACGTPVQAAAPEKRRPGRPRKDAGATSKAEAPGRKPSIPMCVACIAGTGSARSATGRWCSQAALAMASFGWTGR